MNNQEIFEMDIVMAESLKANIDSLIDVMTSNHRLINDLSLLRVGLELQDLNASITLLRQNLS